MQHGRRLRSEARDAQRRHRDGELGRGRCGHRSRDAVDGDDIGRRRGGEVRSAENGRGTLHHGPHPKGSVFGKERVSGEGLLDRTQAGQDEVARRNAEETAKARMLGNTILKIKNRPEMTPDGLEVTVQQNYAIAIFTFSKEKPFQVSDKNVEFELDMGRFKIKKKFNLKDMVYQDRLEL